MEKSNMSYLAISEFWAKFTSKVHVQSKYNLQVRVPILELPNFRSYLDLLCKKLDVLNMDANEPSRARVWLSSTRTRKLIVKLDSTRKLASLKFSNSTRTRKLNPSSNSTRNRLEISSKTQSRAQKLNSSSNSA